jgi:acetyl esterase/lipase
MKHIITALLLVFSIAAQAQINQPTQPTTGPGGSEYIHGDVTQYDYGTNGSGGDFWLYEPNSPTPDSANVVVFIHGLGETNPKLYGAFIKHLVRKGNIVIYPRYQTDLNTNSNTFNDSCAYGIKRALDTIQQAGHVKGRIQNYFVLGHSVGGVLTANMTMLHAQYGLPKPLTAFSIQPGAAVYLMNDYSSFPADVKYLIAVGTEDAVVGTAPGNTLYNQTVNVPTSHKNLITQYTDKHGSPISDASHFAPLAADNDFDNGESNLFIIVSGSGPVDGVDYYCFWKLQDALMDCALRNDNCEYAFGDTPEQHGMDNWSDGTPVRILEVTPSAATAVNDVDNSSASFVYPNPSSSGTWQIALSEQTNASTITVTDITGSIVYTNSISNHKAVVNVQQPLKAMYIYTIQNSEGAAIQTGKLLTQ